MLDQKETEETCNRLKVYPNIVARIKEMLDLMEKKEVESVDSFEEALIPEVRGFGREIMQTWAITAEHGEREGLENQGLSHHSKKNFIGVPPLEK